MDSTYNTLLKFPFRKIVELEELYVKMTSPIQNIRHLGFEN